MLYHESHLENKRSLVFIIEMDGEGILPDSQYISGIVRYPSSCLPFAGCAEEDRGPPNETRLC